MSEYVNPFDSEEEREAKIIAKSNAQTYRELGILNTAITITEIILLLLTLAFLAHLLLGWW
jgi:hypothetical protein